MDRTACTLIAVAFLTVGLAGCLAGESPASGEPTVDDGNATSPSIGVNFTDRVHVIPEERSGYEPSVLAGPNGTAYVTAHKDSLIREGDQLSSWLKYAPDGENWSSLPSPQTVHEKMFALEGDLARDDEGRIYYMDTWAADNTLSRWTVGDDGPTWDFSRPVHGTTGVDDRPWLAAHGDGVVYYVGNNAGDVPAPNNVQAGDSMGSRYWFYRSTDGGMTWSPGHGFSDVLWCTLEAATFDDATVYVGCNSPGYINTVQGLLTGDLVYDAVVFESTDRGQTWERTTVASLDEGVTDGYPQVAADDAGTPYMAWPDGAPSDGVPTSIEVAHRDPNGSWTTADVTPFNGTFERVWLSAAGNGTVAMTFYGTDDAQPTEDSEWYAYALVTPDIHADDPVWNLTKLDPRPVDQAASSPGDFFQNDLGPDGILHVTYERNAGAADDTTHPTSGNNDILYTRERLELADVAGG